LDFKNRRVWGEPPKPGTEPAQPVIVYALEVVRNPITTIWTMLFPMMATQGLLVLLHVPDNQIQISDMATIALAMFAFLTSIRQKLPDVPVLSDLDRFLVFFVLQLALVFVSFLCRSWSYEPVPQNVFFAISAVGFLLQIAYINIKWIKSAVILHMSKIAPHTEISGADTRTGAFNADAWIELTQKNGKPITSSKKAAETN